MQPKIVVLDGYTLNPGDISWEAFETLGEVTVYDRTASDQIIERVGEAEMILTNKTPLSSDTLAALPGVRYIGVLATGTNIVDIDAATAAHITVTNTPSYGPGSVAQQAIALLLELCNRVAAHDQAVHAGQWVNGADFCFTEGTLVELVDKTMGVVGLGAIGRRVAAIAAALGMQVIGHDPGLETLTLPDGQKVELVAIDDIFARADAVSLHCPLTADNEGLVNTRRLAMMKPTAFLINNARGPLVDEPALADALNAGQIAGAGLDVLSSEPPAADNPLLTAKNCIITPHCSWASRESRERLMGIAAENLRRFLAGEKCNVVNG